MWYRERPKKLPIGLVLWTQGSPIVQFCGLKRFLSQVRVLSDRVFLKEKINIFVKNKLDYYKLNSNLPKNDKYS